MDERVQQIVIDQITEVQTRHPNLELLCDASGALRIRGGVGFSIEHDSYMIEDCYNLEFEIPDNYPTSPPFVYETEGKIPKDFNHFMEAGNFCLGAPVEIQRQFAEHKNLLRFIEDQVIPYLFAYSYKRDYGKMPFGELWHGTDGLLQYYMKFFGTPLVQVMELLKCLADDFAPPLMACPCGGGRKLRDCHGPKLTELRSHLPPKRFETELLDMIKLARAAGIRFSESKVRPKRIYKKRDRQRRKRNKGRDLIDLTARLSFNRCRGC